MSLFAKAFCVLSTFATEWIDHSYRVKAVLNSEYYSMSSTRPPETSLADGGISDLLRKRTLLALVLVATVGGTLVFPFPMEGRIWGDLFDLAHAPVFCLSLICLVGFLDPSAIGAPKRFATILPMTFRRVLVVAAFMTTLGLVGEYLQKFANRSPSWLDVAANSAGLLAGCTWVWAVASRGIRRKLLVGAAVAILLLVNANPALEVWDSIQQIRSFPVLASFERSRETGSWATHEASFALSDKWATDGKQSLAVAMHAGQFPGVAMLWMNSDWTEFRSLKFDIKNTNNTRLTLIVKVQDKQHTQTGFEYDDRFHQKVEVAADSVATVNVDLNSVKNAPANRTMDMTHINMIDIFAVDIKEPTTFYLDYVRLE